MTIQEIFELSNEEYQELLDIIHEQVQTVGNADSIEILYDFENGKYGHFVMERDFSGEFEVVACAPITEKQYKSMGANFILGSENKFN